MSDEDRRWMHMSRYTSEWQTGCKNYVQSVFGDTSQEETAPCPCTRCRCMSYRTQKEVRTHVAMRGFDESFIRGEGNGQPLLVEKDNNDEGVRGHANGPHELVSSLISSVIHGEVRGNDEEEPNETAKKLYQLLEEAKKELYPGCKEVTKISFIVMLYQIKCMDGLSNGCLERILRSVVRMKPRTLFSVPESEENEQQGQIDIDLLDVGVETMIISSELEELTNWTRNDLQGVTGDSSIIEKAIPVPEPNDEDFDEDDDNDDTYKMMSFLRKYDSILYVLV